MQTTQNYGFKKPEPHDTASIMEIGCNWDNVDSKLKEAMDKASNVTDEQIGVRVISDTVAPTSNNGTLSTLFGGLANMIKQITGKSSWRTAPATTLETVKGHMDATANVHGATSAATANTIMQRDTAGRSQVVAPVVASDVANKAYVDSLKGYGVGDATTQTINDFNNPKLNSVQWYQNTTLNRPEDAWGHVFSFSPDNGSNITQLAQSTTSRAQWIRSKVNGTWYGWRRLVTADGDTMTGSLITPFLGVTTNGDAILQVESTQAASTTFRRKQIYSSTNVYGGDGWLFRQVRPSDNALIDYMLYNGAVNTNGNQNYIWHSNLLRWNNGTLEYNNGGTWVPVGGAMQFVRGSFSTTSTSYVTALDINGGGELRVLNVRDATNTGGKYGYMRVTIDGVVYENFLNNTMSFLKFGSFSGNTFPIAAMSNSSDLPICVPFKTQLKIELRHESGVTSADWMIGKY
ncbi:hypothetical protein GTO89_06320 [Heliobacterium gestii]|uniref:Uncharacterized protein n=1 Tax=Heliomicrobium gestii TaxID=2699 RepID=A0A845L7R2_HELGE|nr:pyocin knob domain-containing protein [Heliomicrobium gestii]MBM7866015.1 hypothetical protein [Heliomicrobium gestii]MZP42652.1 hypothetical protein [Heliomicrobium gestii]